MSRGSAPVSNRNRERPPSEVDGGYVMIMTALLLIPLVAFTALAIDVSSWYSRATELQRTADAAALSAVIWLPDESKVDSVAADTAEANGFKDAVGNITITVDAKPDMNEVEVCVEDGSVTQFFGAVISQPTSLKRCGTARFDMPLQLGSPLNYFGGDSASVFHQNSTPDNYYEVVPDASYFGTANFCQVIWDGIVQGYWIKSPSMYVDNPERYDIPVCWEDATFTPIPSSKNLGFWASVAGPGTNAAQGDAYSPFCYGLNSNGEETAIPADSINCGPTNQTNAQFRTDPARQPEGYSSGYWYSVDTTVASELSFQVFDGSYNPDGAQYSGTGDNKLVTGPSEMFRTVFTIYDADDTPLDMSDNTTVLCPPVELESEYDYRNQWRNLCPMDTTISAEANKRYYINVRTYSENWLGSGANNYALRVVNGTQPANCVETKGLGSPDCWAPEGLVQPELSAIGDMGMYNNLPSGVSEFYLAKVRPIYANRTLIIDLWDAGESNQPIDISVMMPTAGGWSAASACEWFGLEPGETASGDADDVGTPCTITLTTTGGVAQYNGKWLEIRIPLPDDYGRPGAPTACDPNDNPVSDPTTNGCWWKIRYSSAGQIHDTTTWSAHIERGPLQLWE